jgi:hypothetical protein
MIIPANPHQPFESATLRADVVSSLHFLLIHQADGAMYKLSRERELLLRGSRHV